MWYLCFISNFARSTTVRPITHLCWCWTLKMWFQRLPALCIIVFLHFRTLIEPPLRHADHERRFKHKRHTAFAYFHRLELRIAGFLMRRCVRSMSRHDIVQTCSGRLEATSSLRVVLAVDQTHEF